MEPVPSSNLAERLDASARPMHRAAVRKSHTPYNFFNAAEFVRTRMQNARGRRAESASRENPYFIGFLTRDDRRRGRGSFAPFLYALYAAARA